FTVPYALTGIYFGPEFPSLIGSFVGFPIVVFAAKKGFLLPKDSWEFPAKMLWKSSWVGSLSFEGVGRNGNRNISLLNTFLPYVVLAILLVLSRLHQLPIGEILKSVKITWANILGTSISASSSPLYLPGTFLIIAGSIVVFLHRMNVPEIKLAVSETMRTLISAGFVLMFTIPMVRIYINSGMNEGGLESMPLVMAEWVAMSVGQVYPLLAGFIGGLGAFIAGSNTVSNLMFSLIQDRKS